MNGVFLSNFVYNVLLLKKIYFYCFNENTVFIRKKLLIAYFKYRFLIIKAIFYKKRR